MPSASFRKVWRCDIRSSPGPQHARRDARIVRQLRIGVHIVEVDRGRDLHFVLGQTVEIVEIACRSSYTEQALRPTLEMAALSGIEPEFEARIAPL